MFFRAAARVEQVFPGDVQRRLEKGESLQIVDVREPEEVACGTIPNAKNIRLSEIQFKLQEIDFEREVIFVCQSGSRSSYICELLLSHGFSNVKNLTGGMVAWKGDITH